MGEKIQKKLSKISKKHEALIKHKNLRNHPDSYKVAKDRLEERRNKTTKLIWIDESKDVPEIESNDLGIEIIKPIPTNRTQMLAGVHVQGMLFCNVRA